MQTVMFNFKSEVPAQMQAARLEDIASWDAITVTAFLDAEASLPELRRMCYAYVQEAADIDGVLKCLIALPEIETAFIPAQRYLL